jgi:hypothetical protein
MTGTNQRPTRRSTFGWNPSIGILVRALRFTRPPNLSLRRYLGIYSYLSTRRPAPNKVRFMQNISIFTHSAFSCSRSPARGRWPPGCASGAFPPRISLGAGGRGGATIRRGWCPTRRCCCSFQPGLPNARNDRPRGHRGLHTFLPPPLLDLFPPAVRPPVPTLNLPNPADSGAHPCPLAGCLPPLP